MHEAVVQVQLLMAVQKRIAWIVHNEVHGYCFERHHVDCVFDEAAYGPVTNPDYFKAVPDEGASDADRRCRCERLAGIACLA